MQFVRVVAQRLDGRFIGLLGLRQALGMLKALQRLDRGTAVSAVDDAGISPMQTQALNKPLIKI
ncbi:hypothetical protein ATY29_30600 [Rhizobium hidalgonense]|nr:hypothetical protein ATY29_30600 [Rhizobium hidalgonense]